MTRKVPPDDEQEFRDPGGPGPETAFPPAEQRLLRLMGEFRRRQRERPDLVVRAWVSHADAPTGDSAVGFVVEYWPDGVSFAELRIRHDRAVVAGPAGAREARLCLRSGWLFEGADVRSPELMANHLLRLAGETLPRG